LAKLMTETGIIYDFWNCFKTADLHLPEGVAYVALGSHGKTKFSKGNK
jgi:UDP-N-acetyl-D-mannosaminuronic acid dehydrogenase